MIVILYILFGLLLKLINIMYIRPHNDGNYSRCTVIALKPDAMLDKMGPKDNCQHELSKCPPLSKGLHRKSYNATQCQFEFQPNFKKLFDGKVL